jgi:signal transduction histidine kinase
MSNNRTEADAKAIKNIQKSEKLKIISHEFKTPLSTIELNISMIEQMMTKSEIINSKDIFEKIQRIKRSSSKLKSLVDEIGDL